MTSAAAGDPGLLSAAGGDGLIVVATRRLQRQLLHEWAAEQRRAAKLAWPTPAVMTWSDWLAQSWRQLRQRHPGRLPLLLQSAQEALLWEQQIRSAAQDDLLNLTATARSAAVSWQLLHDYELDLEAIGPQDQDVSAWRAWARDFAQHCRQQSWISAAELPRGLLQALADGLWQPPRVIRCIGFLTPTAVQQTLWQALQRGGCELSQQDPPAIDSTLVQVPCRDPADELVRAARWARGLLQSGAAGPVAVVVRDLAPLREEAVAIFRTVLQPQALLSAEPAAGEMFHVSLGRPLADYPVVADALRLLRWQQQPLPIASFARLMGSPFIRGDSEELVARADLDRQLRADSWHEVSVAALSKYLSHTQRCPILLQCLRQAGAIAAQPARRSPGEWAQAFSEWLNCFDWPANTTLDSDEYQTVATWREAMSRFAATALIAPAIAADQAYSRLARMARQQIYQPLSDPAPVQIMGLAEAHGLQFQHLWLAGMSEDEWPPAPRPDPFLPVALQRQAGLPNASAESALSDAQVVSSALRRAAESVVVSFPRHKLEQPINISPLFADLPLQDIEYSDFAGAARWLAMQSTPLESIADDTGPPLAIGESARGGVGLFQDQALCPFRAFSRRRLQAYPVPELDPGISPAAHGELVHDCLKRLWRGWKTQSVLLALTPDQCTEAIEQAVDASLREASLAHNHFSRALLRVQRQRLIELLAEWLQLERDRPPFTVHAVEEPLPAEYCGLQLTLQPDRIDETDNGLLLLDFKTGAVVSTERWFHPRPEQPQLPLYALAAEQPVQAIAFAWVRRGECKLAGVSGPSMAIAGVKPLAEDAAAWRLQLQSWQRALQELADEIRSGWAAVAPKSTSVCRTCDLQPFCRIYEHVAQDDDDA